MVLAEVRRGSEQGACGVCGIHTQREPLSTLGALVALVSPPGLQVWSPGFSSLCLELARSWLG